MTTATWIAVALLAPFWWAMSLFMLAAFGGLSPRWRPRVLRLFDRLERTRAESAIEPGMSRPIAA